MKDKTCRERELQSSGGVKGEVVRLAGDTQQRARLPLIGLSMALITLSRLRLLIWMEEKQVPDSAAVTSPVTAPVGFTVFYCLLFPSDDMITSDITVGHIIYTDGFIHTFPFNVSKPAVTTSVLH